ncbi:MAG: transport protein TonB [Syntrophorhabdus sp. PtaU1.Bin058]|nr:MAG: transport protein TonB [Syntrophorhabdus sp. PtaU1.Bin058]
MKENYAGISVSAVVHVLVIGAFLVLPVGSLTKPKSMLIDFTLEKGSGIGSGRGEIGTKNGAKEGRGQTEGRGTKDEGRGRMHEQRAESREHRAESVEASATSKDNVSALTAKTVEAHNAAGSYSDPQGEVVVRGSIGTGGTAAGTQGGQSSGRGMAGAGVPGGGWGRTLDYGRGGQAERNFAFIRENIMKNITYPERARRMGWEGKVLLSFVVLESGKVQELKVLNSSGFRALDDNAKEAVTKTTFSQKIPYRMVVVLPIEYRLE